MLIAQHQEWHDEFEPREECADVNALRVKFLSTGYRLKFAFIAGCISQQMIDEAYQKGKEHISNHLDKHYAPIDINPLLQERYLREHVNYNCHELSQMAHSAKVRIESLQQRIQNNLKQELSLQRTIALEKHKKEIWKKLGNATVCVSPVEFEKNSFDIYFSAYVSLKINAEVQHLIQTDNITSSFFPQEHAIEIHSTVGDEFPDILRKMKLSHANILFLAHYAGHGVTRRQFVDFFTSQNIQVIFARDVERCILPMLESKITDINVLTDNHR